MAKGDEMNKRTEIGELGTELSMPLSIGGVTYTVVLVDDEYAVVSEDGLRVGCTTSFTHAVELAAMDAAGTGDSGHARDPRQALFREAVSGISTSRVLNAMDAGEAFTFSLKGSAFVATPSKEADGFVVTTIRGDVPMLVGVYGRDDCGRLIGDATAGKALPLPM